MRDTKSIFFKYFIICAAVILISFICLGAVLLLVSSQYFTGEKRDLLQTNATAAVEEISSSMSDGDVQSLQTEGFVNGEISEILASHKSSTGAEFFICTQEGALVCSTDKEQTSAPSDQALAEFGKTAEYVRSDLDGFFPGERHIAGLSFVCADEVYYLFATVPLSEQDSYISSILQLFLICMVLVLFVVLIIVYIVTKRLTTPVEELAKTATLIGSGNFSHRLPEYDTTEFNILGKAFNDMADSLGTYDKMRSSFVANVSHELRTPMTSIGGFVDGILDGTIPPSEEKKYLRIISNEVGRLTRLVRSMLNLARIESGAVELQSTSFSLIETIVDTLVTFEARLEEKNIDIRGLDVDRIILYADNDLVHQVIYNLLENAIKFVDQDGYIEFGFTTYDRLTAVSIKNSGEGLSQEELPQVFDRFYKTDESRGKDKNGVGLGLNIVRSIVKLHGGKIMVRSVKGEYTEFIFTLPNQPPKDKA